jgi:hypothetical protein
MTRTSAPSFDQLVGVGKQDGWDLEAECLRAFQVIVAQTVAMFRTTTQP